MEKIIKGAKCIFEVVNGIEQDYEKWRTLVYKFNKFTMKFPLVALYMSKGFYNENAFRSFVRKLEKLGNTQMSIDEFNETHATYAKYLYMEMYPHYDPSKFNVIIQDAIKSLQFIFRDNNPETQKEKDTALASEILNSYIDNM